MSGQLDYWHTQPQKHLNPFYITFVQLKHLMNDFDDFQIEESAGFDFAEASYDGLFDEVEDEDKSFNSYLNSNYDY